MNTGGESIEQQLGLVSSVGWTVRGMTTYCLEGSVFNAGSAIQWLRDELGFFESSPQINDLAGSVPDTEASTWSRLSQVSERRTGIWTPAG